MLDLIFPNRNVCRFVQHYIRRLQHRIDVQSQWDLLQLAGLFLVLWQVRQPGHRGHAAQNPRELRVLRNARLEEKRRFGRVNPTGQQGGGHLKAVLPEQLRILRQSD